MPMTVSLLILAVLSAIAGACMLVSFVCGVIAARYRKPGIAWIRAFLVDNLLRKPSLYTEDILKLRKLAIACLMAAWVFVPFILAAFAVAHLRGELPGPR